MNPDCVFCKILAGQIPSARIFEDSTRLAFLDIGPIQPGHVLLIPKTHYERLTDMPEEEAGSLLSVLPRLARAVVAATGADGFNIHQTNGACSGQSVPHVHFHIIPRHNTDGYSFHWKPGAYKQGEIQNWQQRIQKALGR
ncbi:MAG TPA: HIT family protein [Candidatus Brocadiia bacterium]|nr:HIT family protein [Candidatus Brocadiia bacterium]